MQVFWGLLAIPSVVFIIGALIIRDYEEAIEGTGELSIILALICLYITPIRMLIPKVRLMAFFIERRRAIGVAAFAYGALHTIFYILYLNDWDKVISDLDSISILTGWIGLFFFVGPFLTSNNLSQKKLGPRWKKVQQAVYIAVAFSVLHWILIEGGESLGWVLPLAVLEGWRFYKKRKPAVNV
jgi:sulfoxide reductase heme-binding subunit YedZ